MHVYVISLEGSEARRAPLLAALSNLGLSFEVYLGVDGRDGLSAADEARIDRASAKCHAKRELTDAEFACALSHLDVHAKLLSDGLPRALVLEDDAVIDASLPTTLKQLEDFAHDLGLLDHEEVRSAWFPEQRFQSGATLWRVKNIPSRTTGYTISAAGAAELVKRSFPVSFTADWPFDISQLKTFAILPRAIARPDDDDETSLIRASREISRGFARWGNPSRPYVDKSLRARLERALARKLS